MKSRLTLLLLVGVCAACAKTIQGPSPQVSGASNPLDPGRTPAAVCNAQGAPNGWRVDLTGDGFAPLPTNVLKATSGLKMPVVSLSGPETYELPRENVFFVDKTHLALQMPTEATTPAKALTPGNYTVTVTNANGKSGGLDNVLQVVPPPTITAVKPLDPFSQTAATRVEIDGTGFRPGAIPTVTASATGLPTFTLTNVTVVSDTQLTAEVPAATPAGTYDLTVLNPEGCAFTLPKSLNVVYAVLGTLTVDPRFGWQLRNQAITIYNTFTAPAVGFSGGAPLVWITAPLKTNPSQSVDIPLQRVAFSSPNIITAVVPDCSGLARTPITDPTCPNGIVPGTYGLKVQDPAGTQGTIPISRGFTVTTNPPPQISAISPSAINTGGLPSSIASELVVTGQNFGTGAKVQIVTQVGNNVLACTLPAGTTAASSTTLSATVPTSIAASNCTEVDPLGNPVTPTGFSLAAGLYVIRVQNTNDASYADFSGLVVTNPAANPELGTPVTTRLSTARADFPLVEASDDLGQHYLYALGGTDGTNPLASVEVAPITPFGDVGGDCSSTPCKFRVLDRTALGVGPGGSTTPVPRRGLAAFSRTVTNDTSYIYVVGGQGASGELATVERAQVLRQADAPGISSATLGTGGGLNAGTYYYRISALLPATDAKNPGGETLASDEEPVTVGAAGAGKVTLTWPCSSAAKYRIYRTAIPNAVSGSERLLDEVTATTGCSGSETYVDNGGKSVDANADRPLPSGALGRWVSMSSLAIKRAGHAVKVVADSVYVAGGFCSAGCVTTGDQPSVERTTFTNGIDLAPFAGVSTLVTARRHLSLALANSATAPNSFSNGTNNNDAYLLAVGGDQGGAPLGSTIIELAKVRAAGSNVTAPTFSASSYTTASMHGGWSEVVANLILQQGNTGGAGYAFRSDIACPGGGNTVGQCTGTGSFSGTLNAAGAGANPAPRYLPGEVLFRAYVYLAGGLPADNGGSPSATLDRIVY